MVGTNMQTPVDASYLADAVVMLRYYESRGMVHQAISVMKKRGGAHERAIRDFRLDSGGIHVGESLTPVPRRAHRRSGPGGGDSARRRRRMTDAARRLAERRVLILTPTGRDAPLTRDVLADAGIRSIACDDLSELIAELEIGAGVLLLSEEALAGEDPVFRLAERMSRQPPWSDLPILLLAHPGADSPTVRMAVRQLGNVTLLERPVRVAALLTATQTALRARQRQFHAREHLQELDDTARALRESEGRLKALFANAAVGIAEVNAEGRFALVNDALCLLLGESRETLLSLPFARVVHADDREDVERTLERLLGRGDEAFSGERRFVRRDGEAIWVKLSISLARTDGKSPARAVAVVEDVTERRHAEQDLLEADRRKDEFLAVLAHELRNPLAPIRNSLLILRMGGEHDATVGRVVDMMERQVQHMVRLVDDLLEVSRISRGTIELRRERVELAAVLRGAIETSRPLIEASRHTLWVDMPEGFWLDADAVRLSQVFANLLNNAAKYTPPGGRIEVRVEVAAGMAAVCVKDNGEGIAAPMLGRVFNMFTQVNTGRRAQGGLGIGLTLARTLAHLHGGSIEASSEGAGKGCEFLVRLPLAEAHAPVPPAGAVADAQPLDRQRVLVVDDNHDAADSLGLLLQFLGAEVHVVHDGRAALEAMASFKPRVVLLDLGMPNMDGLEVARRMREDPQMRQATIVALTGWGQHEDRRRTGEAGFDHHLVKPADMTALQSILSMDSAPPRKMGPTTEWANAG
jgi:PAS domain S-box-containing protein